MRGGASEDAREKFQGEPGMHVPAVAACSMGQLSLVALRTDRVVDGFESMVCPPHFGGTPAHLSHWQHRSVLQSICITLAERVRLAPCIKSPLIPAACGHVKTKSYLPATEKVRLGFGSVRCDRALVPERHASWDLRCHKTSECAADGPKEKLQGVENTLFFLLLRLAAWPY